MTEADIRANLQSFDTALEGCVKCMDDNVLLIEKAIFHEHDILSTDLNLEIAVRETELFYFIDRLYFEAHYYYLGVFVPASPSIMTILATIWKIALWVWGVVKKILELMEILQIQTIHEIMYSVWPAYRGMVDEIFRKVSELSEAVGWGIDGISHLMNAVQGGKNIVGGVLKKSDAWMEMSFVNRSITALGVVGDKIDAIQNDPAVVLDLIFRQYSLAEKHEVEGWWVNAAAWITRTNDMATVAFNHLAIMVDDLRSIENNMPEMVKKYIPQSIWDSLIKVDTYIYDNILPQLSKINTAIDRMNVLLDEQRKKAASLAYTLAHPGNLLLTVDDLPEYARLLEERSIDNVTSREFERLTDVERLELTYALDDFDLVDKALSVAPAPLPFMTLESPERKAITGIIEEPRETWFVGDF